MELMKKPLKEMNDREFEMVVETINRKLQNMKESPEDMKRVEDLIDNQNIFL